MQKAGGIIGLIGGIFGVFAALVTLFIGGVNGALENEGAGVIVGLGWGGILFSFLCIILGAIGMQSTSKVPGALLTLTAIAGAILGGTLVAICMVLGFIGGILSMFGSKKVSPA